jgi:hypothetical protein
MISRYLLLGVLFVVTVLQADYLKVENPNGADFFLMIVDEQNVDFTTERDQATNFMVLSGGQDPFGKLFWIKYDNQFLAVQGDQQLFLVPKKYKTGAEWTAPHSTAPEYARLENQRVVLIRECA